MAVVAPADTEDVETLIEALLNLEEIDTDLFRSGTRLWRPMLARGVFGGQVVALALMACVRTVEPEKAVHSLHSYFLLPASEEKPIILTVQRLRDGKSFATRSCVASQSGKSIFSCMVSFHTVSEPSHFSHQARAPTAPCPDSLPDRAERVRGMLLDPRIPDFFKENVLTKELERQGPIDTRNCTVIDSVEPGVHPPQQLIWFKAHGRMRESAPLTHHQCVAAYASDMSLLMTAMLPTGLNLSSLAMSASLDHTMWFHAPFRADEWLLYDCRSSRMEHNRGFCTGRIYNQQGVLVVSVAQEGLLRLRDDVIPPLLTPVYTVESCGTSGLGTSLLLDVKSKL